MLCGWVWVGTCGERSLEQRSLVHKNSSGYPAIDRPGTWPNRLQTRRTRHRAHPTDFCIGRSDAQRSQNLPDHCRFRRLWRTKCVLVKWAVYHRPICERHRDRPRLHHHSRRNTYFVRDRKRQRRPRRNRPDEVQSEHPAWWASRAVWRPGAAPESVVGGWCSAIYRVGMESGSMDEMEQPG